MEGGVEEEPAVLAELIRAAGGVVWRRAGHAREVLLVHRPKYDDWTFPKGKADPDEDDLACALREVEEETGLRCEPGEEVSSTFYRDRHGRPKVVRYWAMQPLSGEFVPGDEVDEVAWMDVDAASARLTYVRDRDILATWGQD